MFIWRFNPVSPSNTSVIGFKPAKKTVCWAKISRIEEKWNSGKRKSLLCSNQTEQENREKIQRRKKNLINHMTIMNFSLSQIFNTCPCSLHCPTPPKLLKSLPVWWCKIDESREKLVLLLGEGGMKNSGKWHKSWKIGKPFEIPLIHVASASFPTQGKTTSAGVPYLFAAGKTACM